MIRIVTDNGSDITLAEAQALNIERVVLETAFEDGVCPMNTDEDYARFYEKLKVSEKLPITSRPAPQQYLDIYMDAKEKGDGVVVIALAVMLGIRLVRNAQIRSMHRKRKRNRRRSR